MKIAFDGPAASGKSTIAKAVARKLSFLYIDTGAMYRAVTWKSLEAQVDFTDRKAIADIARRFPVNLQPDPDSPYGYRVSVEDKDITDNLFSDEVHSRVSIVAEISQVRKILVARQQEMALAGSVVMAGRDITTVVMPDAEIKIYLTASEEERIKRRYKENLEKAETIDLATVKKNIETRDKIDSTRQDSPLSVAEDAIVLDSSGKSIEQVIEEVMKIVESYLKTAT